MKKFLIVLGVGTAALMGAPVASAGEGDYLAALQEQGLLVYGGEQCHQYVGDDGCSLRFSRSDAALHVGGYACEQLAVGDSLPEVIYDLTWGDGMTLSPDSVNRVVMIAYNHLC